MADENLSLNKNQLLDETNGENEFEANMQIDLELKAIRARVKELEGEAEKIKQMQSAVEKQKDDSTSGFISISMPCEERLEIDARSVYVGNVDYGASAEELESHFHACGIINRITILCNEADGHPKGFAYIEFDSKEYVETALAMNQTFFRGRQLKVMSKRTNHPGFTAANRFARGSFRGRGGRISRGYYHSSCRGSRRPRGYRSRANYYAPY